MCLLTTAQSYPLVLLAIHAEWTLVGMRLSASWLAIESQVDQWAFRQNRMAKLGGVGGLGTHSYLRNSQFRAKLVVAC